MKNTNLYIQCTNCVLDTTVEDIKFDKNGVCNYCRSYIEKFQTVKSNSDKIELEKIIQKIKNRGKNNEYDCIVGVSGGVDSTYLLYWAVKNELKPLPIHVDTGWNSELAVNNIENAVKKLRLDLYTYVIDWAEMKDLQLSFFKASVPDCDIPQDHVFPAILNKLARKHKIHYILSGHNNVTEFILPKTWIYDSNDLSHILDIQNKFGSLKLKKYPRYSLFDRIIYYRFLYKVESLRPINYMDYNKNEIKLLIQKELGWRDYGGKHYESKFTKFFQAYFLPTKFGYDKRKAHLSNLILSGQITKEDALQTLKEPLYNNLQLKEDLDYIQRKLDITNEEWKDIMNLKKKKHSDYKSDYDKIWYKIVRFLYDKFIHK